MARFQKRQRGPLSETPTFKFMAARFGSKCALCGKQISRGDVMLYRSASKIGKACTACEPCGLDWKQDIQLENPNVEFLSSVEQ